MLLPLNSLEKAGIYVVDSMAHYNHQSFLGELEGHQVLAIHWHLTVLQGQEPGNSGPNRYLNDPLTAPEGSGHISNEDFPS